MRIKTLLLFSILALITSFSVFADAYEAGSIQEVRAQYELLVKLESGDLISDVVFQDETALLRQLAIQKFKVNLDGSSLNELVPTQTLDWITSALYLVSVIVLIVLFFSIFDERLFDFIEDHFELLGYPVAFILFYYFDNEYVILINSFLLALLISAGISTRMEKQNQTFVSELVSLVVMLLWGYLAYFYQNRIIGFFAIASMIGLFGFVLLRLPGLAPFGFKVKSTRRVLIATVLTFVMTIISWLVFYTHFYPETKELAEYFYVYRVGMVYLFPLTFFIGLGYFAFFFNKDNLLLRIFVEVISASLGVAVLLISLFYNIGSMFWISMLFMGWNFIDKLYEIVYKRLGFIWAGAVLSVLLVITGSFIRNNLPFITQNLTFLGL